ncbi:MAG: DUF4276 family protein [Chthoniobacterales bacterium]
MTRLLVHVEGPSEETFVNEVLSEYLIKRGYTSVSARIVGNARQRDRRGGIRAWSAVRKDISNHLKEDIGCIATTMVDYYALPATGPKAWPGRETANALPHSQKAKTVESLLALDIAQIMEIQAQNIRFIPYVVMHEFEALLFSDCKAFAAAIYRDDLKDAFQNIRDDFENPEEINDSPQTAPSKRIEKLIPSYEKPLLGTLAALEIGLHKMKSECPQFSHWLDRLETAATSGIKAKVVKP